MTSEITGQANYLTQMKGKNKRPSILNKKRKKQLFLIIGAAILIHFYFSLPSPLFNTSYSKVLYDDSGEILSVKIAPDEQWRFPLVDSLPRKYKTCLVQFEDEYFYQHFGVNPISLGRAIKQNISSGSVKSGGSTISMQLIRLSKQNPSRTIWEKIKEMYQAIRLEFSYSKNEILNLYASHAPFGGNVVGISAASLKYYGRPLSSLSWSEAATLAVLPNSPSLIFPGKNNHLLEQKRNRLLKKLLNNLIIDDETYSLAIEEPLPNEFLSFPNYAPHALEFALKSSKDQRFFTSINFKLQKRSTEILQHHIKQYAQNHIYNGAVLIIDNYSNKVVSYVGNTAPINHQFHENYVDIIQSQRSTGSIIKPFLHASALDDGIILNTTILPDIPTIINGFAPKNYTKTYEGAVKANTALARSLNVPAVRLLQKYGYPRFHQQLKKLGMTTLHKEADHYGLSLILGGAETTLWDLATIYGGMAKTLLHFEKAPINNSYNSFDYTPPNLYANSSLKENYKKKGVLSASAIYETFNALQELKRPVDEGNWKLFENSKKIAWKTGTSFGLRDAWAVGVTPHYTVAVWTGNASGIGRPGLVGILKAAPILFSIFNLLPNEGWFNPPTREMAPCGICHYSGEKAGEYCNQIDTMNISITGKNTPLCHYCQQTHLNNKGKQVNSSCSSISSMSSKNFFILPPVQEWYYIQKSASYETLPPFESTCIHESKRKTLNFIYPHSNAKIYIPRELNGNRSQLICEATHKDRKAKIFWHFDELYLGETIGFHQMPIEYKKGKHTLMIIDEQGSEKVVHFELL